MACIFVAYTAAESLTEPYTYVLKQVQIAERNQILFLLRSRGEKVTKRLQKY